MKVTKLFDFEIVGNVLIAEFHSIPNLQTRFKILKEGNWKKYDNDFSIRLDNRPNNYGGIQLHIKRRDGTQWAYRGQGQRSEPTRFSTPATNKVRDIVRNVFELDPTVKIEWKIDSNSCKKILLENLDYLN